MNPVNVWSLFSQGREWYQIYQKPTTNASFSWTQATGASPPCCHLELPGSRRLHRLETKWGRSVSGTGDWSHRSQAAGLEEVKKTGQEKRSEVLVLRTRSTLCAPRWKLSLHMFTYHEGWCWTGTAGKRVLWLTTIKGAHAAPRHRLGWFLEFKTLLKEKKHLKKVNQCSNSLKDDFHRLELSIVQKLFKGIKPLTFKWLLICF